ncbi:MAG: hypothetical protein ACE37K_08905 [Planctomycetota bacterium]
MPGIRSIACCLTLGVGVVAQSTSEIRDDLREQVRGVRYGAFLTAFLGLAEEAQLSGARFRLDGDPDTSFTVTTLPLRRDFDLGAGLPQLRFEGDLGYVRARFDVDDIYRGSAPSIATRVTSVYEAIGGVAGVGPVFEADGWRITPLVLAGLAHVDNDTDYGGPGAASTRAVTDGILFNWDSTWFSYGAAIGAESPTYHLGEVELVGKARLDYRHVRSLQTDDPAEADQEDQGWLSLRADAEGPMHVDLFDRELRWTGSLGYKRFLRDGEELLGFDDYFQVGVGALWDCSELVPVLHRVGLNVSFLYGENVQGWTFGGLFRF